jgi:uncharacterized RDD family membrane protein YckC
MERLSAPTCSFGEAEDGFKPTAALKRIAPPLDKGGTVSEPEGCVMAEAILRRDQWWQQQPDGSWLRWSEAEGKWEDQAAPPPPPDSASSVGPSPPSVAEVIPAPLPRGAVAASWGQRAGAQIIDGLGVTIVSRLVAAAFISTGMEVYVAAFFMFSISALYFAVGNGSYGQTLGKKLVHIRVCDERTGDLIGPGRAFLRWLVGLVMWILLYVPGLLDVLWPLWDSRNQALHDKIVKSLVVLGDKPG